jgi:cell wall-associated NlpC family hydrolase
MNALSIGQTRQDVDFTSIPWKDGGCDWAGADCRGLTLLWLRENLGFDAQVEQASSLSADAILGDARWKRAPLERGDVVFFAQFKTRHIRHCAVYLGADRYLHAFKGCESRIVNGHTLLSRMGLVPAGVISPDEAERLCGALADPKLGTAAQIVLLVIAIALSIASAALAPKRPRTGNTYGRYSDQQNVTQVSSELPLADPLGQVVIAGNSPYTQLGEKGATISDVEQVKWNKLVVLASAPLDAIDFETDSGLLINGLAYNDKNWRDTPSISGFLPNPAQTKAEAVDGTFNGESHVPSFTTYDGAHAISVPVDIRASYDRTFPVYGLSGSAYIVWRLMNSEKHTNFNMTVRVKGRRCRQFDDDGFVQTTVTGESLAGADGAKVRFKLAQDDIAEVTALTVNGTAHSAISAGAQTGNVYSLNKLKGYVEFITAPAASATISITYTYYPREWTQNPAMHVVYLLTEKTRGKGYGEERLDWPRAVVMRDFCDEQVVWDGAVETRYQCNYAIDFRKPIQEHLRAVLDACNGLLFLAGGKFVMKARGVGSSVMSFTQSEIMADSFASELLDRAERANRIKLAYHSEESANAETEVIVDDRNDQLARESRIGNDGVKDENLKLAAVASLGQTERLGDLMLREQINAVRACEFVTNIKGLPLEPGDIIDVTHSADPAWTARKAWIDDIQYDQDDRLKIRCFEYYEPAFAEAIEPDAWDQEAGEAWNTEGGDDWDLEQDPNFLNADMWSTESGETWETEAGQAWQLEAT